MKTILDTGESWLLSSIEYGGLSLTVILKELFKSNMLEDVDIEGVVLDGCYPLESGEASRLVKISFDPIITYQVINESGDTQENGYEYESSGFISVIKKSAYLDFVVSRYGWYEEIVGKSRLYSIWSEDEIVEVFCPNEPVSVLV